MHQDVYKRQAQDYEKIEKTGEKVLEKVNRQLKIRAEICLKAAYASFRLGHEEKMMKFCWECFCSESTEKNFLRLFGTKEMAAQYGMRGKEVLKNRIRGNCENDIRNTELHRNIICLLYTSYIEEKECRHEIYIFCNSML